MKVYLAGPMSGIPAFNFPEFKRVTALLRSCGWEVISPAEEDHKEGIGAAAEASPDGDPTGMPITWGSFLARDVKLIADGGIQGIVFLKGWEKSRGARLEASVGLLIKGMLFFEQQDDGQDWEHFAEIGVGDVASVLMVEALRYQETEHPLLDVIETLGNGELYCAH
jgi:hypothetical protein